MTVAGQAYLTITKFALIASIIQEEKNQSGYCYSDTFSYLLENALLISACCYLIVQYKAEDFSSH